MTSLGKNKAAVSLGRLGGLKGGPARALALTPERRTEIARKAAEKRWGRPGLTISECAAACGISLDQLERLMSTFGDATPSETVDIKTIKENKLNMRNGLDAGATIEVISPEVAAEYLKKNSAGRKLTRNTVASYTNEMATGQWRINGETIKFTSDGRLLDGQHRLTACVNSGVPFVSYVVRGVSDAAFDSIDTGKNRSASDLLQILGSPNSAPTARAVRLLWMWEGNFGTRVKMPRTRIIDVLERHPGIVESVAFIKELAKKNGSVAPVTLSAFGHYVFNKVDQDKAREFFERLYDGLGLEKEDAIYMLRQRFIKIQTKSIYLRDDKQVALLFKAWNMYYTGRSQAFLRNAKNDGFPEVAGLAAE